MPTGLADAVLLFTDEQFQAWEAVNAAQLHEARKRPDPEADRALATSAARLNGQLCVGDLSAMLGLGGPGFRAILRLIFSGGLRLVTPGIIGPRTLVTAGGPA